MVVYEIASFWFIIMTQGAHLQHESMVGKEGEFRSWAKRQAATSMNFRPDSRFWGLFTGGLNVQSLHHVAPCVGSSQLIDIYPEYKKLCARHGVPLKEVKNLLEFCRGFLGWIAELARDDGEDDARLRQGHGKRE
uniref:Fatty acid desaturase domain-containing protein n=1 Tax=Alexandrium andersonii TaxID=327968 RepID=A0A7S2CB93_9DINO